MDLVEILMLVAALSVLTAVALLVGLPGEERFLTWQRLLIAILLLGVGAASIALAVDVVQRA
ncbi:MAG TPA: hypothetical protein VM533_11410 [Fimbriiglobus sp.]|jgi:hypothetical protein|nr:hypothetical protein [Fimbriiglobus sp.]